MIRSMLMSLNQFPVTAIANGSIYNMTQYYQNVPCVQQCDAP